MNSLDKQAVLHCLKSMIDEEVCEECLLYGTTGTDHCEKDCVRLAINALNSQEKSRITQEQLNVIRSWLVRNIFRDPEIMLSDSRFIEVYGDPGEKTEIDMAGVIASLYEVLHQEVTGEPYNYFFHHANKCGAWVEDNMFTDMIGGVTDGD